MLNMSAVEVKGHRFDPTVAWEMLNYQYIHTVVTLAAGSGIGWVELSQKCIPQGKCTYHSVSLLIQSASYTC